MVTENSCLGETPMAAEREMAPRPLRKTFLSCKAGERL